MFRRRAGGADEERSVPPRPFDAAEADWVSVEAKSYFFEPYCTELVPTEPGDLVILLGNDRTRSRGVEIAMYNGEHASIWVPSGGRVFWRREAAPDDRNVPWECRLVPFKHDWS